MNSVGLNIFIAVVGISSGPDLRQRSQGAGLRPVLLGPVATAVPMHAGALHRQVLFRFDDAINLGCCGGARTTTASVAMVGDVAKSQVPVLGYTVPYAVGNTL